jgi:hypothetical protein
MAEWPLARIGEALIDGEWVSVPMRESTRITITRGIGSEAVLARPGSMTVRINDPDGTYSPRNPESGLYEKFGKGTQFRFRVGDVPTVPAAVLTDVFSRTVSNGWGTSTSGTPWAIYDPFGVSPPASEYSVSGGTGLITTSTIGSSRFIATNGLDLDDYEALFSIATDTLPVDASTENGITLSAVLRADTSAAAYYTMDVTLLPNTGLPDDAGLRVSVGAVRIDTSTTFEVLTPTRQIPGLIYAADSPLWVRVRCDGPELRMRVWADGSVEPDHWHAHCYDDTYTSGEFGLRARVVASSTPTPVAMSFDGLEVRPLAEDADTVRIVGEIAGLEPNEDEDGWAAAYTDLDVAGVLRRYDGPQKPIKSAMRRHISVYGPLAYWTFEEGAQGDTYVAEYGQQSTAGPLTVSGLDFARDDTLVGSSSLPVVRAGGTLRVAGIQGEDTGYWAVYAVVKFTSDGFPTDASQHEMLAFSTSTASFRVVAQLSGGDHLITLIGTAADGTSLGSKSISHEEMVAAGKLGILDRWQQIKVYAEPSGANTAFVLALLDPDFTALTNSLTPVALSADHPRSINTVFGTGVKGMGIGHISIWGSAFTNAYTTTLGDQRISFELGAPGLTTRDWMTLLATDQALALDPYGPATTLLGPYAEDSFINLIEAAARTDAGLLVEHRDQVGLKYLSRELLYNKPVELVLDYTSGQIFAPFQPKDDDKDLHNRITAKRRAGSEATAELTEGRLSTQQFPDGIGVQDTSVETIVYSDDQLPDQAAWRLHVATWDEMRVASITLKMANPRMHALLDTVLALKEGSRIQVINTPKRYGPDGFDLLIRGSREVHGEGIFDITFNCTPYGPWNVGVTDDPVLGRADTDGSELASGVSSTATSLSVAVTAGPLWLTSAAYPSEFPFDIRAGGEVMQVSGIASWLLDAYDRSVSGGWGTADSGQAWTASGGTTSTDYAVGSGYGQHILTTTNATRRSLVAFPYPDIDIVVSLTTSATATGASIYGGPMARYTDANNLYMLRVEFTTANAINLDIRKRVAAVESSLGTYSSTITHVPGTFVRVRLQISGSTILAKIWPASGVEPQHWHVSVTDTSLTTSVSTGCRSIAASGNTNTNPQVRYDNLEVLNPQAFTVTRSVNGVVKPQTAGTAVQLATPMIIAL